LNLYDTIATDSYVYEGVELMTSKSSLIGTFFMGSRRVQGFPSVRLQRKRLREVLLSEVKKKGVEVIYEKVLKELSEDGDVVELVFEDGAIITSRTVIGADGLRSIVRKAVAPDVQPYYNGFTVIYGLAEHIDQEAQIFPIPSMILGPEGSFGIIPVDPAGKRLGFLTGLQLPDRPLQEWQAFRKDKSVLRALLAETFCNGNWPRTVQALCKETLDDEVSAWP
jgi:2-polyprenyl-6-methoxyphenol hydroxylase-like FAD-dependent oxidoreductase